MIGGEKFLGTIKRPSGGRKKKVLQGKWGKEDGEGR